MSRIYLLPTLYSAPPLRTGNFFLTHRPVAGPPNSHTPFCGDEVLGSRLTRVVTKRNGSSE